MELACKKGISTEAHEGIDTQNRELWKGQEMKNLPIENNEGILAGRSGGVLP